MMTNNQWNELREEHEMTHFRADVCLGSPQSFSLEEKKRICEEMEASTAEVDAALKKDFESLPHEAQGILLDMLCASGCMTPEFWKEALIGKNVGFTCCILVGSDRKRHARAGLRSSGPVSWRLGN